MGADGGTIPKRCELVKKRTKKEKIDKHVKNATKWRNCQLTQLPLKKPVIACRLGKLYNKEDVINAILNKTIAKSLSASHIKGTKDFVELKLAENKDFKKDNVKGDEYDDVNQTEFLCPITNSPMNGMHSFLVNWLCGCVYSEKAQQEVKSVNCHVCGGPYDATKIVILNPDDSQLELYKLKLEAERAEKKAAKSAKKAEAASVSASSSAEPSTSTDVQIEKKKNKDKKIVPEGLKKAEKRKIDIQSDPTKSDTYKKLFTSCEDAKKKTEGHWKMLSVPLRTGSRGAVRLAIAGRTSNISGIQIQHRFISSADIFKISESVGASNLPPLPTPPPPALSLEEIVANGGSVLEELGLWSWYKPSSYFRYALEGIHNVVDIPWWTTIVVATVALRLLLIGVPIMSQKLVARQSMYRKEMNEFRDRIDEARKENNQLLQQQILLEQRDFLRSKDIRLGRQFGVMLANGGVFATQFFAVKKMIAVNYPGLATGGTLWFTDLTACDPYYALPFISAATMALVTKVGIEMGTTSDQMPPIMRAGMQYGLPVVIFIASSQFATGLCVYWCASNMVSLVYAGLFKIPVVRKALGIPKVVPAPVVPGQTSAISQVLKSYKDNKSIPPSLSDLRKRDATTFKKAGRGKPIT
ncbi:unnamed protein product [Caenorhabditis angaria]|uniref:Replication termination factor 2 n=1 Tax=Caenorhabditis angaria TaxID=860376 RepID=A0A9P1I4Y3_9PELO|nr:unnamed protein product [Caenorhabditis angaria]